MRDDETDEILEIRPIAWIDDSLPSDAVALEALGPEEAERRRYGLEQVMSLLRPFIQADGGDLALTSVDYVKGIVEVELQGACGSCAVSEMTVDDGVDRIMKQRLDWVTEIHGNVDESADPLESAALGRGAYVPKYY